MKALVFFFSISALLNELSSWRTYPINTGFISFVLLGMDGTYKVWDYTRINRAPNKVDCLELQPSYQKTFSDNWGVACPVSFQRTGAVSNPRTYYMQVGLKCT